MKLTSVPVALLLLVSVAGCITDEIPVADEPGLLQVSLFEIVERARDGLPSDSPEWRLNWATGRENRINQSYITERNAGHVGAGLWDDPDPALDGRTWGWIVGFMRGDDKAVVSVDERGQIQTDGGDDWRDFPWFNATLELTDTVDSVGVWSAVEARADVQTCVAMPAMYGFGWTLQPSVNGPLWGLTVQVAISEDVGITSGSIEFVNGVVVDSDMACPALEAEAVLFEPHGSLDVGRAFAYEVKSEGHQVLWVAGSFDAKPNSAGSPAHFTITSPDGTKQPGLVTAGSGKQGFAFTAGPIVAGVWTMTLDTPQPVTTEIYMGFCAEGVREGETQEICAKLYERA